MSRIMESIEVRASADTLFHCAVDEWERWAMPLRNDPRGPSNTSARMGNGFRVHCAGKPLGLPEDPELEVRAFVEGGGWVATSAAGPGVSWRWSFSVEDGPACRLACTVEYAPAGPGARLVDRITGRRRRARTMRRLLEALKIRAEREEALARVNRRRQASGPVAPGPADDGVG